MVLGSSPAPDDLEDWLRLTLCPGVGPTQARRLLAALGPPEAIFSASHSARVAVAGPSLAQALSQAPPGWREACVRTRNWLQTADGVPRGVLSLADAAYPQALLALPDPPPLLYWAGHARFEPNAAPAPVERSLEATSFIATIAAPERCLAMVGSRNPTAQGADNARAFALHLAQQGWTVVSGLADGVDGAAHTGALQATVNHGCTVAVVGTGLDQVYPRKHHDLARAIAQRGLIISELPLGTPPLAANFPRRNRLIAALSRGVLVVEAALRSGSLITARLANELGREVFAIPGSIHSAQAKGCHALIKQGAKLVESAQDILDELGSWGLPLGVTPRASVDRSTAAATPQQTRAGASPTPAGDTAMNQPAQSLLSALGWDPVGLDVLLARTGWATDTLQTQLSLLELDGSLTRLPGGLFQRRAQGQ